MTEVPFSEGAAPGALGAGGGGLAQARAELRLPKAELRHLPLAEIVPGNNPRRKFEEQAGNIVFHVFEDVSVPSPKK